MHQGPTISEILAEAFYEGHLPTDLSSEVMELFELTAMGPPAFEQLRDLVRSWEQRGVSTDALYNAAMGLYENFDATADQARPVAESGPPALEDLLHAIVEALSAMAEACYGVAEGASTMHGGALRKGLLAAEEAAAVLQEVYDGTHY